PCAGGAVYSPAMTDFIFMVEITSYMFVTGPNVVKTVTHEEVTSEELGGAMAHGTKSGVTHFVSPNEADCIQKIKKLLSYIPQNCEDIAPVYDYATETLTAVANPVSGLSGDREVRTKLNSIIPETPNQ